MAVIDCSLFAKSRLGLTHLGVWRRATLLWLVWVNNSACSRIKAESQFFAIHLVRPSIPGPVPSRTYRFFERV